MEVKIENAGSVVRELSIVVPAEEVDQALARVYKGLRKEAKLKGFRKGKAPESVIKAHFREYAIKEAEKQLVAENYKQALLKHEIPVVSSPEIQFDGLEEGRDFLFKAMVEVAPELPEMTGYEGIPVKSRLVDVQDVDIDNAIERMRSFQGKLVVAEPDYEAQKGDYLIFDYTGEVDGKPIEGSKRKEALHKLGDPNTLAEFDEALIGAKANEKRVFDSTYPDDFPNKELAGKTATFEITVKEVKRLELPEVDETFIKGFGNFEDINSFREFVKSNIQKEREEANRQWMEEQILSFLLKRFSFDLPNSWVTKQASYLLKEYEEDQKRQGINIEETPLDKHPQKKVFFELAERQVKAMLILDKIAKKEGITVGEDDLKARYEKMSEEAGVTADQVHSYYASKQDRLNLLKDELLRTKTLDYLREHAVVEWVKDGEEGEKDQELSKKSDVVNAKKGKIITP